MTQPQVELKLNDAAFVQLTQPGGIVDLMVAKAAGKARDEAKKIIRDEDRVDTGALMQSIKSERVSHGASGVRYQVGSDLAYAILQEKGVQGPIYPRRARVLRFKPKGATTFVFARSVKGFEGIHFLKRAVDSLTPRDFE